MKKFLTLTLFLAAMFIAGSLSAQERVSKTETTATDTAKVKPVQDTKKDKKDKKKSDDKAVEKKENVKGTGSETDRMAIDELGMPVEKKDKKKKAGKSGNTTGTKQD